MIKSRIISSSGCNHFPNCGNKSLQLNIYASLLFLRWNIKLQGTLHICSPGPFKVSVQITFFNQYGTFLNDIQPWNFRQQKRHWLLKTQTWLLHQKYWGCIKISVGFVVSVCLSPLFAPAGQSEFCLRFLSVFMNSPLTLTAESVGLLENLINRVLIYFPEGLCVFLCRCLCRFYSSVFLYMWMSLLQSVHQRLPSDEPPLLPHKQNTSLPLITCCSRTLLQRVSASQWTHHHLHSDTWAFISASRVYMSLYVE